MANWLKNLRVSEISLVDAPANPGAVALLYKRKEAAMPDTGPLDRLLTRLGLRKADPGALDPDTYLDAASGVIGKAQEGLAKSLASILADKDADKPAAIAKTLDQFGEHVEAGIAAQIEKAMRDVALAATGKDHTMTLDDLQKANTEVTARLAKAETEIAIGKLSPAHKAFYEKAQSPEDKAKFLAMTQAEKDKAAGKADDDETKKRALPDDVREQLAKAEDMRKRLEVLESERELTEMRKRMGEIGLPETQADTILKAQGGDAKAFDAVLAMIKAANEQARTAKLFGEFGSTGGGAAAGTARAEVDAGAETLRKADPKLSLTAARVAVRKAQPDLAQRERNEERAAIRAVS